MTLSCPTTCRRTWKTPLPEWLRRKSSSARRWPLASYLEQRKFCALHPPSPSNPASQRPRRRQHRILLPYTVHLVCRSHTESVFPCPPCIRRFCAIRSPAMGILPRPCCPHTLLTECTQCYSAICRRLFPHHRPCICCRTPSPLLLVSRWAVAIILPAPELPSTCLW